ncbi:MAG: hypothetical protein WAL04_16765 [Acidimicrobiales bacterium]
MTAGITGAGTSSVGVGTGDDGATSVSVGSSGGNASVEVGIMGGLSDVPAIELPPDVAAYCVFRASGCGLVAGLSGTVVLAQERPLVRMGSPPSSGAAGAV